MSFNPIDLKLGYFKVFKAYNLTKCITSTVEQEGQLVCASPFTEGLEKTFSFSKAGWKDSSNRAKGSLIDLLADLSGYDREAPEVLGLGLELGIDISKKRKSVYTFADLIGMDLPVPQTWLGGFVGAGEATLIVSLPGVGKTWFTLAIAQCLASGKQKLGPWQPTVKKKTLIVDFEMGPMRLRQRLEALRRGYGIVGAEDDIGILSPELCMRSGLTFTDLAQPEQIKMLHDALADYDAVIIDNINAAYPTSEDDENGPKFWGNPQNLVMSIRQTGKACIMVHHATKGDPKNPAGSGRNTRFFDNVLALVDATDYSKTDTKKISIHIKKCRHFPSTRENQPELELRDFQGGTYWSIVEGMNVPYNSLPDVQKSLNWVEKDGIPW